MRSEIQLKTDLKLAFMDYGHTVMDKTSDKAAADASAAKITDAVTKLAQGHLALSNNILYDIVTPDQRAKTYECMIALHKKGQKKGSDHGKKHDDHRRGGKHGKH